MSAAKTLPGLSVCSCLLHCLLLLPASSHAAEFTAADTIPFGKAEDVRITIFDLSEGSISYIVESRDLELPAGHFIIQASDVSDGLIPVTVRLQFPDGDGPALFERNYNYDLVDISRILERMLGRNVIHVDPDNGTRTTGRLLSVDGSEVLLETPAGIASYPLDGLALPADAAQDLYLSPSLDWECHSETGFDGTAELGYLSKWISWSADYDVVANADLSSASLSGWTTISNNSAVDYLDAKVQLIAGEVNLVTEYFPQFRSADIFLDRAYFKYSPDWFGYFSESFFEYHLYNLRQRTDLLANQTKQISFVDADDVSLDVSYKVNLGKLTNANVVYKEMGITNSEENNLGFPLPQGHVRLFADSAGGSRFLLGVVNISHTARDEALQLFLGESSDLKVEQISVGEPYWYRGDIWSMRSTEDVVFSNFTEQDAHLNVRIPFRRDWELITSSHTGKKHFSSDWSLKNVEIYEFEVVVPAGGNATLSNLYEWNWR